MTYDLAYRLMREQGLEYEAKLEDGHIVRFLDKQTAQAYYLLGAEIISPMQGPHIPDAILKMRNA